MERAKGQDTDRINDHAVLVEIKNQKKSETVRGNTDGKNTTEEKRVAKEKKRRSRP